MMMLSADKGLTLIELVMAIVIAAIVLTPTSIVIVESVRNAFLPEHLTIASSLAEREIERVTNLRFSEVAADSNTYTGDFSDYSWDVDFYYVAGNDLNTSVSPAVTGYKRVTITISRPGFPDVSAVTVLTDN
ncbi:MAG: type II secretion system protein [Candidatus Omnitrophica bacterium]|nr:type II secretion system protein [Candidatus Omnitrophota bacterium]